MANILIIDDADGYRELCLRYLPEHTFEPPARNYQEASAALARRGREIDLVLLDVHFDIDADQLLPADRSGLKGSEAAIQEQLRRTQGFKILEALRPRYPDLPVIVMTSVDDLPIGLDADRLDAENYTYLLDDDYLNARSLRMQIDAVLSDTEEARDDGRFYWGTTRTMRGLRQRLEVLARGQLPLIVGGPTGVGKSLLAREYIHERSGRRGEFVAVDLSTIPADLMAAHLFGVVKGAYTGATAARDGVIRRAKGGTLFLDEIGNLSLELQKSLLLVLQDHRYRPVGSVDEEVADVKLVVATNEDLGARVRAGAFREDLWMRLNPATAIRLPSLKERRDEFDSLMEYFVQRVCEGGYNRDLLTRYAGRHGLDGAGLRVRVATRTPSQASPDTLTFLLHRSSAKLLREFEWPGNFRQFEMVLSNLVTFTLVGLVERDDTTRDVVDAAKDPRVDLVPFPVKTVSELLQGFEDPSRADDEDDGAGVTVRLRANDTLNAVSCDVERQYLEQLYLRHEGDLEAMAAALLGDEGAGRKIQLRMNQLGIRLRVLRQRVRS